jgi:hypothetical protein
MYHSTFQVCFQSTKSWPFIKSVESASDFIELHASMDLAQKKNVSCIDWSHFSFGFERDAAKARAIAVFISLALARWLFPDERWSSAQMRFSSLIYRRLVFSPSRTAANNT